MRVEVEERDQRRVGDQRHGRKLSSLLSLPFLLRLSLAQIRRMLELRRGEEVSMLLHPQSRWEIWRPCKKLILLRSRPSLPQLRIFRYTRFVFLILFHWIDFFLFGQPARSSCRQLSSNPNAIWTASSPPSLSFPPHSFPQRPSTSSTSTSVRSPSSSGSPRSRSVVVVVGRGKRWPLGWASSFGFSRLFVSFRLFFSVLFSFNDSCELPFFLIDYETRRRKIVERGA